MSSSRIQLELLPHERAVLRKWYVTPEVRAQLDACSAGDEVVTIAIDRVALDWISSDLIHAIVKKDCRDELVFELSDRLEYVQRTGDGSLDAWY